MNYVAWTATEIEFRMPIFAEVLSTLTEVQLCHGLEDASNNLNIFSVDAV